MRWRQSGSAINLREGLPTILNHPSGQRRLRARIRSSEDLVVVSRSKASTELVEDPVLGVAQSRVAGDPQSGGEPTSSVRDDSRRDGDCHCGSNALACRGAPFIVARPAVCVGKILELIP